MVWCLLSWMEVVNEKLKSNEDVLNDEIVAVSVNIKFMLALSHHPFPCSLPVIL